jgi:hypothetical protein
LHPVAWNCGELQWNGYTYGYTPLPIKFIAKELKSSPLGNNLFLHKLRGWGPLKNQLPTLALEGRGKIFLIFSDIGKNTYIDITISPGNTSPMFRGRAEPKRSGPVIIDLVEKRGCPHRILSIERKMNAEQKFTGL